jgi:ComF family protein
MLKLLTPLTDLFFPEHCLHCQKKTISRNNLALCIDCEIQLESAFKEKGEQSEIVNKFKGIFPISQAFSMFYFAKEGVSQSLIHEAKYLKQLHVFEYYGKVLSWQLIVNEGFNADKPDYIIPVPNHWFKRLQLGYNQAEVFAKSIAKDLNIKVLTGILKKKYDSSTQARLAKLSRLNHVQNLFYIADNKNQLAGKNILLVDDVITSGATIEVCAKLLLESGVKKSV